MAFNATLRSRIDADRLLTPASYGILPSDDNPSKLYGNGIRRKTEAYDRYDPVEEDLLDDMPDIDYNTDEEQLVLTVNGGESFALTGPSFDDLTRRNEWLRYPMKSEPMVLSENSIPSSESKEWRGGSHMQNPKPDPTERSASLQ